ncbi:MAG: response regulator transcription factor [Campylobacteraceae bacterium]
MSQNPLKKLNVLFVEDEELIRRHIVKSLEYIVGEVKEASNGVEALKILKSYEPDVVITDLEMPVMNGIEFIKKIREKNSDINIIVLTAHSSNEYLLELIDMHLENFIVKPINFDKMIDALEKIEKKVANKNTIAELPDGYEYNFNQKILTHNNKEILLSKKEILFLELLFKNSHKVITYSEIETFVWQDSVMTDNAIRSLVKTLRAKLPEDFVVNLSGVGYKLA